MLCIIVYCCCFSNSAELKHSPEHVSGTHEVVPSSSLDTGETFSASEQLPCNSSSSMRIPVDLDGKADAKVTSAWTTHTAEQPPKPTHLSFTYREEPQGRDLKTDSSGEGQIGNLHLEEAKFLSIHFYMNREADVGEVVAHVEMCKGWDQSLLLKSVHTQLTLTFHTPL